jgi:integrase
MTVAYYTGWRCRSEVFTLTWARVDRQRRLLTLDPDSTKNDEGRTFPYGLLPELVEALEQAWRAHEALRKQGRIVAVVFPDADGEPLGPYDHYVEWRAACAAAGTPGRIPHDFRRTAVRNLVRAGVPERVAMQLTGHKTRSVFDRYDIVDENDLTDAVTRLAKASTVRSGAGRR